MQTELDSSTKALLMLRAHKIAEHSTCASRQVGAILVTKNGLTYEAWNEMHESMGTCGDRKICRCFYPNKVSGKDHDKIYAVHAEEALITNCARVGVATSGATMITTTKPCQVCARLIISAGIKSVIYDKDFPHEIVDEMFTRAGITVERLSVAHELQEG